MQHRRKRHGVLTKPSKRVLSQALETVDCSTLMRAASTGRVDILGICLQSGLSINLRADDGFSALHCAARMDQVDALQFLLRYGADANMYSDNSTPRLPIYEAVLGRSLDCFSRLLEAGARTRSLDGSFRDIIDCITTSGDARFVQGFIGNPHIDMNVRSTTNALALAAAGRGQLSIVQALISSHPEEVQVATTSHQSPLYLAAKRGHTAIVKSLLGLFEVRRDNLKALGSLKSMSLRAAAKRGHLDVVRLLLDPSSSPISSVESAMLPAIENGHLDIVKLLATSDQSISLRIPGYLRLAIQRGHVDIVAYFASSFVRSDPTKDEDNVLQFAIDNRSWAGAEALLCSNYGNVNTLFFGMNALHSAALNGDVLAMRMLLQHKDVDVNIQCENNEKATALGLAIANGNLEIVSLLLRHTALDVNKYGEGGTALHEAVQRGRVEILPLLLDHPAIDVNAKPDNGNTALHVALSAGVSNSLDRIHRDRMGELLLGHKSIDPTIRTPSGDTALELAERYGHWSSFKLLLDREEHTKPSRFWFSDPRAVQCLLQSRGQIPIVTSKNLLQRLLDDEIISVNARRPDGKTLLHHAAEHNDTGLMRFLLNHVDLDPGQLSLDYNFGYSEGLQTPMGIAVLWDHKDIVDLLQEDTTTSF